MHRYYISRNMSIVKKRQHRGQRSRKTIRTTVAHCFRQTSRKIEQGTPTTRSGAKEEGAMASTLVAAGVTAVAGSTHPPKPFYLQRVALATHPAAHQSTIL